MSDSDAKVFLIEPSLPMRSLLDRAIKDHKIENVVVSEAMPDSNSKTITFGEDKNGTYNLPRPYYLASLLSSIERLQKRGDGEEEVVLGPYMLDIVQNSISVPHSDKIVKLTEKERDILLLLNNRYPDEVPKDVLLDQVWGYGAQIETHTLETHIYRLRQKIEKDSSKPEFLITNDKGYKLAI